MKKLSNVFNLTNLVKILVIFSIGFISRILIYHYLGINIFSEFTHGIYYFSVSSFLVYFDQLFSYQCSAPINVEPANIKSLSDYSKGSLLFQKDSTNSFTKRPNGSSKTGYVENKSYMRLRPSHNGKGDILLLPAIDFSSSNSSSRSSIKLPSAPKPSNLSTPSTMSPLFNSEISNSSSHTPRSIVNMSTNHSIKNDNSTKLENMQTNRVSNPRNLDYSSVKRQIMQDIQIKIKEAEIIKEAETIREVKSANKVEFAKEVKTIGKAEVIKENKSPCKRILSASK
jgi:hypothetical protein